MSLERECVNDIDVQFHKGAVQRVFIFLNFPTLSTESRFNDMTPSHPNDFPQHILYPRLRQAELPGHPFRGA